MNIIPATLADASELNALINSAYRGESAKKGWTNEAHLLDGIRINEPTLAGYLRDPKTVILKCISAEGQILGCVYLKTEKNRRMYLGMLTVSPALQANGIGRQLLRAAEMWAVRSKCKVVYMTVITSRTELLNWYARRGYRNTGKIIPFPADTKFGIPREPIELVVLEKEV
ncbi:MAG: GNAT family N-acetyltransferase [Bacteroidetes bacterium]|nr:GNAT family N-acetyltransferase [Bacteroidota bacterium]